MTRWLVERRKDVFEDVGFEQMAILPSGALAFFDDDIAETEIVYAPGQWTTVVRQEDE
jgi:hypothetical protein